MTIKGGEKMSNLSISFEEFKNDLLKDIKFKVGYEKLKPEYGAIQQFPKTRKIYHRTKRILLP